MCVVYTQHGRAQHSCGTRGSLQCERFSVGTRTPARGLTRTTTNTMASLQDDVCIVCDDGGNLLHCGNSERMIHLACLNASLARVSGGKWLCPACTNATTKDAAVSTCKRHSHTEDLGPDKKSYAWAGTLQGGYLVRATASSLTGVGRPVATHRRPHGGRPPPRRDIGYRNG